MVTLIEDLIFWFVSFINCEIDIYGNHNPLVISVVYRISIFSLLSPQRDKDKASYLPPPPSVVWVG